MYSFAQRPDTRVVDEPLYAHFLKVSGRPDPGREDVLAACDADGERVVREVVLGPCDRPVLFMKQMAHHLVALDRDFLRQCDNVLLVRDPTAVLHSLAQVIGAPTLRDTGLDQASRLLHQLQQLGQDPPVLDSARLLRDPAGVLSRLCARLGLSFTPAMLSWTAGPRSEDGVWAPHWYAAVHRSTGFAPYRPPMQPLPGRLLPVLAECMPHYEELAAQAL